MAFPDQPFVSPDQGDIDDGLVFGAAINMLDVDSFAPADIARPQQTIRNVNVSSVITSTETVAAYYIIFNYKEAGRKSDVWRYKSATARDSQYTALQTLVVDFLAPVSS